MSCPSRISDDTATGARLMKRGACGPRYGRRHASHSGSAERRPVSSRRRGSVAASPPVDRTIEVVVVVRSIAEEVALRPDRRLLPLRPYPVRVLDLEPHPHEEAVVSGIDLEAVVDIGVVWVLASAEAGDQAVGSQCQARRPPVDLV